MTTILDKMPQTATNRQRYCIGVWQYFLNLFVYNNLQRVSAWLDIPREITRTYATSQQQRHISTAGMSP